ncbi:hypothetical protein RCL1_001591 [Eukaryota sp. TZLM3-RCL]
MFRLLLGLLILSPLVLCSQTYLIQLQNNYLDGPLVIESLNVASHCLFEGNPPHVIFPREAPVITLKCDRSPINLIISMRSQVDNALFNMRFNDLYDLSLVGGAFSDFSCRVRTVAPELFNLIVVVWDKRILTYQDGLIADSNRKVNNGNDPNFIDTFVLVNNRSTTVDVDSGMTNNIVQFPRYPSILKPGERHSVTIVQEKPGDPNRDYGISAGFDGDLKESYSYSFSNPNYYKISVRSKSQSRPIVTVHPNNNNGPFVSFTTVD